MKIVNLHQQDCFQRYYFKEENFLDLQIDQTLIKDFPYQD
jgi:hypothetical protein